MKKVLAAVLCAALVVLAASCSMKVPAQATIKAGEEALNAVKGEAVKYVPEQFAAVEKMLTEAKAALEKGDFKGAIQIAKDVPEKAQALVAAIEARKAELPGVWEGMAKDLPKLISDTKATVTKAKGLDQAARDEAGAKVKEMEENWKTAEDAFKKGALVDAVNMAEQVKQKGTEIQGMISGKIAGK